MYSNIRTYTSWKGKKSRKLEYKAPYDEVPHIVANVDQKIVGDNSDSQN